MEKIPLKKIVAVIIVAADRIADSIRPFALTSFTETSSTLAIWVTSR